MTYRLLKGEDDGSVTALGKDVCHREELADRMVQADDIERRREDVIIAKSCSW